MSRHPSQGLRPGPSWAPQVRGVPQGMLVSWGSWRARVSPWRGNYHLAYLAPLPEAPLPSAEFGRRCLELLPHYGYSQVVTGALSPSEQLPFLAAGFEVREHLHLLSRQVRDLDGLPPPAPVRVRRAHVADRRAVLELDRAAFGPFWRLDGPGLDDALHATPAIRFRIVVGPRGLVAAYALTGRAGRRGFFQRLAVDPPRQREGLGTSLVVDGLRWLRRWRVDQALVNTQLDNAAALALYTALGFRIEPEGLSVLSAPVWP